MSGKTINLRVSGELEEHIEKQIKIKGLYETTSEYVRDLIRHDMRDQSEGWKWLKGHLEPALRADESEYVHMTAEELIKHNEKFHN